VRGGLGGGLATCIFLLSCVFICILSRVSFCVVGSFEEKKIEKKLRFLIDQINKKINIFLLNNYPNQLVQNEQKKINTFVLNFVDLVIVFFY